jgi:hypothetical protein
VRRLERPRGSASFGGKLSVARNARVVGKRDAIAARAPGIKPGLEIRCQKSGVSSATARKRSDARPNQKSSAVAATA